MAETLLDGPRVATASGNPAKQLVVLLHGYGADGNDLIGLAPLWQSVLPDAAFVSPHAPEPCAMNPFGGRQWFELSLRDPSEYWRGVQAAAPHLNRFLDAELAKHNLDDRALALVGFSQGTMMALHVGLRRKVAPAALIGYSGLLAGPEHLKTEVTVSPPVLLVHGDQDDVIPVSALSAAETALKEAGLQVKTYVSSGVGHGIDQDGLELAAHFLTAYL